MATAMVIHADDNVAIALEKLEPEARVELLGARSGELAAAEAIPFGHKLAIRAIAPAEPVKKYGEVIGLATASIAPGAHVHVHNIASQRV